MEFGVVSLTKGKYALVSFKDLSRVLEQSWCAVEREGRWYAQAYIRGSNSTRRRVVYLHRFIMQPKSGELVDHVDGDGLDCRRENLRIADPSQNSSNKKMRFDNQSGYRGVYQRSDTQAWVARISFRNVEYRLGQFDSAESAARAYDEAAIRIHGDFARTNFPRINTK